MENSASGAMASNNPKTKRSSKDRRSGSPTMLSFLEKKGKFAGAVPRIDFGRVQQLRTDALEDFKRSTETRSKSVHQMAAMFKGKSKPENMEAFQKRYAQEEAAYREKVHQGKETLKKYSQGTNAMYNFVVKLNLATTEGKERFLRRWATGRMANGESTTLREGWKFLKSLGIDVPRLESPRSSPEKVREILTPARGRTTFRENSHHYGPPATAGSSRKEGGAEPEVVAWKEALSRAVGAMAKIDADACGTRLDARAKAVRRSLSRLSDSPGRFSLSPCVLEDFNRFMAGPKPVRKMAAMFERGNRRIRRSRSVPGRAMRNQAPGTYHGPRSKPFFGACEPDLHISQSDNSEAEFRHRSSWSPEGSKLGKRIGAMKAGQRRECLSRPQSLGFGAYEESPDQRLSMASRLLCLDSPSSGEGEVLSLPRQLSFLGRLSLSPERTTYTFPPRREEAGGFVSLDCLLDGSRERVSSDGVLDESRHIIEFGEDDADASQGRGRVSSDGIIEVGEDDADVSHGGSENDGGAPHEENVADAPMPLEPDDPYRDIDGILDEDDEERSESSSSFWNLINCCGNFKGTPRRTSAMDRDGAKGVGCTIS